MTFEYDPDDVVKIIAALGAMTAMVGGLILVYVILKNRNQSFGPESSRVVAMTLFVPGIILIALATDIEKSALTALLGTVAGYLLSRESKDDGSSSKKKTLSPKATPPPSSEG